MRYEIVMALLEAINEKQKNNSAVVEHVHLGIRLQVLCLLERILSWQTSEGNFALSAYLHFIDDVCCSVFTAGQPGSNYEENPVKMVHQF